MKRKTTGFLTVGGTSYFKDCHSPLYYCLSCEEAEEKAAADWKAMWARPKYNQGYESFDEWWAAMEKLLIEAGWCQPCDPEDWRESWEAGDTPAQALREDMTAAC